MAGPSHTKNERRRLEVRGRVQGVGFGPFVYRAATEPPRSMYHAQPLPVHVERHLHPVRDLAREHRLRQAVLDVALDRPLDRRRGIV